MRENPACPSRRRSTFTPPFQTISIAPDRPITGFAVDCSIRLVLPTRVIIVVGLPTIKCRFGKNTTAFFISVRAGGDGYRPIGAETDSRTDFQFLFSRPLSTTIHGPIVSSLLLLLLLLFLLLLSSSSVVEHRRRVYQPLTPIGDNLEKTSLARFTSSIQRSPTTLIKPNFSSIVRISGMSYNGSLDGAEVVLPIIIVLHPITVCNARPRYTSHTDRPAV